MRLQRLRYENFGPFKGDQAIDFGQSDGVVVIYGDNNFGKTTLLNSVRWLFTGRFLERTGKTRDSGDLVNTEALNESGGSASASVSADVHWRGETYSIRRTVSLDGGSAPVTSLHVIRESNVLAPEEAQMVLQQMIPEEIQQFFLFDAEALNRYEDLLHDPSAGDELKKAIERILGVPVLRNAVRDLGTLIERHTKVIAKLDTKDAQAKAAAHSLAQLNELIDGLDSDRIEIADRLLEAESKRGEVEARLEETATTRKLVEDQRFASARVNEAKTAYDSARTRYHEVADRAWEAVIAPRLEVEIAQISEKLAELEMVQTAHDRELLLGELRAELAQAGVCPCCGQPAEEIPHREAPETESVRQAIADWRRKSDALLSALDRTTVVLVQERHQALQTAAMHLHDAQTDLEEADAALEGMEAQDLVDLPSKLANIKQHIRILKDDLSSADAKLVEHRDHATKLAAVVAEHGGKAGAEATRKQNLLTALRNLYSSAIATYRDELKCRVEKEASEIFIRIRSDPEFVGLSINDDYGLSIMHEDGAVEPHRSAGYEHIVALCLIAALQRCAPVKGPIFMDMPFARLDPGHTLQTLRALPSVAEQMVLIVHRGEVDHDEAVEALGDALVLERELKRHSARHTEIVQMGVG